MDRSGKGIMGFFDLKIMMTTTRTEEKKLFEQEKEQYKYLEVVFIVRSERLSVAENIA